MRIDYIKPFAEAASDILYQYIGGEVTNDDISLQSRLPAISGVISTVSLSGYVEGYFVLSMSEDTAIKMINIMSDIEFDGFNKFSVSIIQELINLIVGTAITKLDLEGYDVNMATPVIMSGNDLSILTIRHEALQIKVNTIIGNFNILVSVESEKE